MQTWSQHRKQGMFATKAKQLRNPPSFPQILTQSWGPTRGEVATLTPKHLASQIEYSANQTPPPSSPLLRDSQTPHLHHPSTPVPLVPPARAPSALGIFPASIVRHHHQERCLVCCKRNNPTTKPIILVFPSLPFPSLPLPKQPPSSTREEKRREESNRSKNCSPRSVPRR